MIAAPVPPLQLCANMFQARQPDVASRSQNAEARSEDGSEERSDGGAENSNELEFEKILKARDELLEGLAHDLKNALSSIVMNTSLARRVVSSDDQCVRQMIERIQEASDRIQMAMQDALDMTGCISGNLSVKPMRREVKVLVGDALAQVDAQRVGKNITFQVSPDREGLTVIADQEKVPTALSRLFAYGIKVSPSQSRIEIRMERDRNEVQFRMILPPEIIAVDQVGRIFERQGKKPGLYLVRGIAEIFDGRTWAKILPDGRAELGMSLKNGVPDGSVQLLVQS